MRLMFGIYWALRKRKGRHLEGLPAGNEKVKKRNDGIIQKFPKSKR